MDGLKGLKLDSFLPLSRMDAEVERARNAYREAQPFPHVVLDDFFDPALLEQVLSEFPAPGAVPWQKFDNAREIKLASSRESTFGPLTRLLMYHLNSATFLDFMGRITGIPHLIPDPEFEGGGLHQIVRGGKLGVHADFNRHGGTNLDRRLNLILYLNKDWKEEYGGHLELWDRGMTACQARVLPVFNRVMVFGTTDFTYHGHPTPLQCPEGWSRKSLALYYFSNGRPAEEVTDAHSTLFRARHDDDFKLTLRQRAKGMAADLLPPILTRALRGSRQR